MNKFAIKENGFEYVDLGLPSGTMWAICNVGAKKPEDVGLLFQFGRVDGYKCGSRKNNFRTKDQNKQDTGNEFIPKTISGKIYDNNDILDLDDDAAHVNMGGAWKMPTKDQLDELYDNTTHDVVDVNGVKGMMFTSNINKRKLFMPFMKGSVYNLNWDMWNQHFANIWSSQVYASNGDNAYALHCATFGYTVVDDYSRRFAYTVRGVFKK